MCFEVSSIRWLTFLKKIGDGGILISFTISLSPSSRFEQQTKKLIPAMDRNFDIGNYSFCKLAERVVLHDENGGPSQT
jgi:hypothetical protein